MGSCVIITTKDWEAEIWCPKNLERSKVRSKTSRIHLNQTPLESGIQVYDSLLRNSRNANNASTESPLFLDNLSYQIRIRFNSLNGLSEPFVRHSNKTIEDSFAQVPGSSYVDGNFNTGNDLGWLDFQIGNDALSIEVVSSKMDFHQDVAKLQEQVEQQYPLWSMSFQRQTSRGAEKVFGEQMDLFWLMLLQARAEEFIKAVKMVLDHPHSRLLPETRYLNADRIKRMRGPLEERVAQGIKENPSQKFRVEHKRLSIDTPENRFVKHAVQFIIQKMGRLILRMQESKRMSDTVVNMWNTWHQALIVKESTPFFKAVGHYKGFAKESLVLHHRAGYASAYRCWIDLRKALRLAESAERISAKNVAELYEVWCFIEIKRLLEDILGKDSLKPMRKGSLQEKGLELQLENGIGAAYLFETGEFKVILAHEPVFKRKANSQKVLSYTIAQKPDILLNIQYPDGERLTWVFDAKYRIRPTVGEQVASPELEDEELASESKFASHDLVPDDAINQMHRYRDAIIYQSDKTLSRETIGAFALYPGRFDQSQPASENPYFEWIQNVNIGAFPLLPYAKEPENQNRWLKLHLESILRRPWLYQVLSPSSNIFPSGTAVFFDYPDIVMVAPMGSNRTSDYQDDIFTGSASWYHFPARYFSEDTVPRIAHLAVTVNGCIHGIYQLTMPTKKLRAELTLAQTGIEESSRQDEIYWLVELSNYQKLQDPIRIDQDKSWFHFVLKRQLETPSATWSEIRKVSESVAQKAAMP